MEKLNFVISTNDNNYQKATITAQNCSGVCLTVSDLTLNNSTEVASVWVTSITYDYSNNYICNIENSAINLLKNSGIYTFSFLPINTFIIPIESYTSSQSEAIKTLSNTLIKNGHFTILI